jgi:hypothetical protein
LFNRWLELVELIKIVCLTKDPNGHVWLLHSSSNYSVRSFYGIVNNDGVVLIHTLAVWKLHIPPRIHIFMWLLSNDKLQTRDNLSKRRPVEDGSCLFCNEQESARHVLFVCVVAKQVWTVIFDIFNICTGASFESASRWWLIENKNSVLNVFSYAVL